MNKSKPAEKTFPWLSFIKLYFLISLVLIFVSCYSLFVNGVRLGVEFQGGSELVLKAGEIELNDLRQRIEEESIALQSIVPAKPDRYIIKTGSITEEEKNKILSISKEISTDVEEVSFQKVGPSIGPELIRKTIYAIIISSVAILFWIAFQFKNLKFGVSAILAMLHDSFILLGSFSLLGVYFVAELDFLFVTAMLTTLSFSVHDTIVVFDRIREIDKKSNISDFEEISNKAITETMRRSVVNSLTIIMMLLALVILGGSSIRWFATALLIGAILGTYSSPFVAVPIYTFWAKRVDKRTV